MTPTDLTPIRAWLARAVNRGPGPRHAMLMERASQDVPIWLAALLAEVERLREEQRLDLADRDRFRSMARRHEDERDSARADADLAEHRTRIFQATTQALEADVDTLRAEVARLVGERDSARWWCQYMLECARGGDVIPQDLPEWLAAAPPRSEG